MRPRPEAPTRANHELIASGFPLQVFLRLFFELPQITGLSSWSRQVSTPFPFSSHATQRQSTIYWLVRMQTSQNLQYFTITHRIRRHFELEGEHAEAYG